MSKKEQNRIKSTALLVEHGIKFDSKNNGIHLIVDSDKGKIDYWPSTGKYIRRCDKKTGRGVFNLINMIQGTDGCSVCGQYPYLEETGMCGVCTFGTADAINDLYSMDGVIYE